MFEPQEIRSEHKDVIHDVLYDYYGQRIATCSSDQTVKVSIKLERASELVWRGKNLMFIKWHTIFIGRFGIKMRKAHGLYRPVGKRIPVPCGVYHGHIPNLVQC